MAMEPCDTIDFFRNKHSILSIFLQIAHFQSFSENIMSLSNAGSLKMWFLEVAIYYFSGFFHRRVYLIHHGSIGIGIGMGAGIGIGTGFGIGIGIGKIGITTGFVALTPPLKSMYVEPE